MTTDPNRRILVVTPTLGESPFLDHAVASVGAQPLDILHVIVTPDDKMAALQARFPHARVCRDAGKAGGLYGALNAALDCTRDEWDWFTYINDDDALLPGFATVFSDGGKASPTADVIYGDVELVDQGGRCVSRITTERNPEWFPALLQQGISPLMQQGMLFRRAVVARLHGFDTRYRLCGDLDFWLRAYAGGARFCYHRERVGQFRLRGGQLSANTALTEREQAAIVARHLPRTVSALRRHSARWRYRWCNLPRYVARLRTRGFHTSYELLRTEEASP